MMAKTLDTLSLEELTETYLCSKYGKDPIKCLDCEKHMTCPAGKRAIELLNDMTESKKLSKWEKASLANSRKAKARATEILKHKDPRGYLMECEGISYDAARERIRKYRKQYPDLIEKYHPEMVDIAKSRDEAKKQEYKEAVASGDPVRYYQEKYGTSYDAAYQRCRYARLKYENAISKEKEEPTVNNVSDDEISLKEFLNLHDIQPDEEEEEAKEEKVQAEDNSTTLIVEKYNKLILERNRIEEAIDELKEKLEKHNKIIESFDTVMRIIWNDH